MKFYVIYFENGETKYGNFPSYGDALNYVESINDNYEFIISEYDSEEDYYNNI